MKIDDSETWLFHMESEKCESPHRHHPVVRLHVPNIHQTEFCETPVFFRKVESKSQYFDEIPVHRFSRFFENCSEFPEVVLID